MLVSRDKTDKRPIGFAAQSKGGYSVFRGISPRGLGILEPTQIGGPYSSYEDVVSSHPEINFDASEVCEFCGRPTPCLRED